MTTIDVLHHDAKSSLDKIDEYGGNNVPRDDIFAFRSTTLNGGYRFGKLSHNSFFTRHNPHPVRVRHMKGLLDVPICSVNDDGYFASPRYSLRFPPNNFINAKLKSWHGRLPVNFFSLTSKLHPINTITGLQYFTGLNSYPWREKAIPNIGLVTDAWRDELKRFTDELSVTAKVNNCEKITTPREVGAIKPRNTSYSPQTGRLIPSPYRAASNGSSKRGQRAVRCLGGPLQHIAEEPDVENAVLGILCQILQTEDINAIQAWLCTAGEPEKSLVMNMIRVAISGQAKYWKQYPPLEIESFHKTTLPPINKVTPEPSGEINRLVLEEKTNKPEPLSVACQTSDHLENNIPENTNDNINEETSRNISLPSATKRALSQMETPKPISSTTAKAKEPQVAHECGKKLPSGKKPVSRGENLVSGGENLVSSGEKPTSGQKLESCGEKPTSGQKLESGGEKPTSGGQKFKILGTQKNEKSAKANATARTEAESANTF